MADAPDPAHHHHRARTTARGAARIALAKRPRCARTSLPKTLSSSLLRPRGAAEFFFVLPPKPLHRPTMHVDGQLLSKPLREFSSRHRRVLGNLVLEKLLSLRPQLSWLLRAPLAVHQPHNASVAKEISSRVEGFPRIPELLARMGHSYHVNEGGSKHLVLNLNFVERVEKVALLEQRAHHQMTVFIPGSSGLEKLALA